MGTVIGDLLPLALGVAISPVPIIAVILMLLSPRAGAASVGFAVGWLVGIVTITAVTVLVASGVDIGGDGGEPSTAGSWVSLVLGLLLVALGVKQWRDRPEPGESAPLPKWMAAIDNVTPVRAVGLGFLLSAVNPKNLLMCVSAGVAVADGDLTVGDDIVVIAVFTVLAGCSVLAPVVGYLVARERMARPLDELKGWLVANNATVMSLLLLVIGVTVLGKGLGGLL